LEDDLFMAPCENETYSKIQLPGKYQVTLQLSPTLLSNHKFYQKKLSNSRNPINWRVNKSYYCGKPSTQD
jgi:hypothetical protein